MSRLGVGHEIAARADNPPLPPGLAGDRAAVGEKSSHQVVGSGTLAFKDTKGTARETIAARLGDGSIALPTDVLIDTGTSGAAELFAAALAGNKRAELGGEHTIGRA